MSTAGGGRYYTISNTQLWSNFCDRLILRRSVGERLRRLPRLIGEAEQVRRAFCKFKFWIQVLPLFSFTIMIDEPGSDNVYHRTCFSIDAYSGRVDARVIHSPKQELRFLAARLGQIEIRKPFLVMCIESVCWSGR